MPSPHAPAALRGRLVGPAEGGRALRLGASRCGASGEAMPGWQGLPLYQARILPRALLESVNSTQHSSKRTQQKGLHNQVRNLLIMRRS